MTKLFLNLILINLFNIDGNGQKTRLISIPSFQKSQTIAVLNLNNLDCEELTFTTKLNIDEE